MKTLTKILIIGGIITVGVIGAMYYINTHKNQVELFALNQARNRLAL